MPLIDVAIYYLRIALLVAIAVFLVIAALDWAVRTRRINPFSSIARFCRRVIDPMLAPIEARVVRSGDAESGAVVGLGAAVVIGVLMIVLLQWVRTAMFTISIAASQGGMGIAGLVVEAAFEALWFALIVRVIVSWIGMRYSWWARTAFTLTDWLVKPIARALPPMMGIIDFSVFAAMIVVWLAEKLVLSSVFGR